MMKYLLVTGRIALKLLGILLLVSYLSVVFGERTRAARLVEFRNDSGSARTLVADSEAALEVPSPSLVSRLVNEVRLPAAKEDVRPSGDLIGARYATESRSPRVDGRSNEPFPGVLRRYPKVDFDDETRAEISMTEASSMATYINQLLGAADFERAALTERLAQYFGEGSKSFSFESFEADTAAIISEVVGPEKAAAYTERDKEIRDAEFESNFTSKARELTQKAALDEQQEQMMKEILLHHEELKRESTEHFNRILAKAATDGDSGPAKDSLATIAMDGALVAFRKKNEQLSRTLMEEMGDTLTDEQRNTLVEYLASDEAALSTSPDIVASRSAADPDSIPESPGAGDYIVQVP